VTPRVSDDDHGRPVDITTLTEDDRLLDQLGRGERPDGSDAVEALLSDWRATLPEPDPTNDPLAAGRRPGPAARWSLVAAGTALIAFGGVTAAAEHAGPGSPLWPITRLVYGDAAESRTAAQDVTDAVAEARVAIGNGEFDRAARLLAHAATRADRIDDPKVAAELRTRIATVRGLIPTAANPLAATPPAPGAAPSAEQPAAPTTDTHPPAAGEVPDPTEPPALLPPLPATPSLPVQDPLG
jgi:hypothetical protein